MDELIERLNRLDELTTAELRALEADLVSHSDSVGDDLEALSELADSIEKVREAATAREQAEVEKVTKRDELLSRIKPAAAAEVEVEVEAEVVEPEPEPETEETSVETPVEEPVRAIAAASSVVAEPDRVLAAVRKAMAKRPKAQEAPASITSPVRIFAGPELGDFSAGQEIPDMEMLAEIFAKKWEAVARSRGITGKFPVATLRWEYPEDRNIQGMEALASWEKIEKQQSLVAAGGLCAPVNPYYGQAVIATASRPVRNALTSFNASRGGISLIRPPTLSQLASGVVIWTEANDTTPADPTTKPCVVVSCGTPVEVDVSAIPLCVEIGNFNRRFFVELFNAWWQLGLAQHAREAEANLLSRIGSLSTATTTDNFFGASRDWLENLVQVGTQYRNRNRMDCDAPLTVLAPCTLRDKMIADLIRTAPGDDSIVRANAIIDAGIRNARVNVTWVLEDEDGAIYGSQPVGHVSAWSTSDVWYLHHPGAFLFLDGGELDFGMEIRDSGLNETNDSRAMFETFEEVAFVGVEAIKVTSDLCASGAFSLGEDSSAICTAGS